MPRRAMRRAMPPRRRLPLPARFAAAFRHDAMPFYYFTSSTRALIIAATREIFEALAPRHAKASRRVV